jgi:hypothetical protein
MAEVVAEWQHIKTLQVMRRLGGGAFGPYATLYLDKSAVDDLCTAKAQGFETALRGHFPAYDSFPADAQLGLLSMIWNMGDRFGAGYPKFTSAVLAGDWVGAAAECGISNGSPARNAADVLLFTNATKGTDPDTLYWPKGAT